MKDTLPLNIFPLSYQRSGGVTALLPDYHFFFVCY